MKEFIILMLLSANIYAENLYDYKVVKVIDGDTVTVQVNFLPIELGDRISIRIHGIDTPELRGKCLNEIQKAKDAKMFLSNILKNREYKILIKGRDKYFRLIGDIKIGEQYVSRMMIERGFAVSYNGKTHKQSWCNNI